MLYMTTIWCINRENSGGRGGFVGALNKTFHQGIILIFIVSFCTKAVYTALGIIYELSKFINQLNLSMWWFVPIVLKSFLKIDNYVVCPYVVK